jgi:hypothetical protein
MKNQKTKPETAAAAPEAPQGRRPMFKAFKESEAGQ